ncbi:MAG: DUF1565 domain-containing protein [Magnetococcus sp. YQC-3]
MTRKPLWKRDIRRRWIPLMIFFSIVCGSFLGLLVHPVSAAASYFVSTTGDDTNPGTQVLPFKTIHRAYNASTTGSNIYIQGGTYTPYTSLTMQKNGTIDDWYIIQPYMGETVIINGTNSLHADPSVDAIFKLKSVKYVRITGLIFEWSVCGGISCNYVAQGVVSNNVIVDNCTFRRNGAWAFKAGGGSYISFNDNYVYYNWVNWHVITLSQETISFSTVSYGKAHGNILYDNPCENIDMKSGCTHCEVTDNEINTTATHHATKGGTDFCGGIGIYLDCIGTSQDDILIDGNWVYGNVTAIQVSNEGAAGHYSNIQVSNNVIHIKNESLGDHRETGRIGIMFTVEGTAPDANHDLVIMYNTIYMAFTDAGHQWPCIETQTLHFNDLTISNNILALNVATADAYYCQFQSIGKEKNIIMMYHNVYENFYAATSSHILWNTSTWHETDTAYFQDGYVFADPLFHDRVGGDFNINSTSPCKDVGYASYNVDTDYLGSVRPQGAGYDLGAYEYLYNSVPIVSGIPDQTIAEGSVFTTLTLDNYVVDWDNDDAEITWSCTGQSSLSVSISSARIATVSIPYVDWYGAETLVFRGTDPLGQYDTDTAVFTVTAVNDAPIVTQIPGQTVELGSAFGIVDLDLYVSDIDNNKAELVWTFSGESPLVFTLDDHRLLTITNPSSVELDNTVTITCTDPGALYDSCDSVFQVVFPFEPVTPPSSEASRTYEAEENFIGIIVYPICVIGLFIGIFWFIHSRGWF